MQCPRCGAPVVLDESECIVQCGFCRTRHALHTDPFPCYYIEPGPKMPAATEPLYVPYWRFRGMEFSLDKASPGFRVIDHSCLAVNTKGLPPSLGLRPQARPLKFIGKDTNGVFLPPEISGKTALKQMTGEGEDKIYIGETLSLIFMPLFRNSNVLCDGLTGIPVSISVSDLPAEKKAPGHQLSFTPCLCPDCGWDLKGRTDSLVIHCSNCTKFWLIRNKKLNRIDTHFSASNPDTKILMPFWRLQVEFNLITCSTYADLIKIANIPKAVQEEHKKQLLYFYIPAFKINPKLFLRIVKQMTLAQISSVPAEKIPEIEFHPTDLPLDEGAQAVFPALAEMAGHRKETINSLKKEKLKIHAFSLMYISFQESGSEYAQKEMGISLPKNALQKGFKP